MPTKIPQIITTADIRWLKEMVAAGGASQAYTWLADKGYPYPLLARGVVNSDTLSGVSALTFMDRHAIKQTGTMLSRDQEVQIKQDMANACLD
ncbi:hypothetical protein [Herbaspirillum sp. alder98]|uniref:hypothetical protein n=1 Tax=Herbaspirillum sp. alder98 TaxID=2913096 RepID=UPI001CD8C0F0|nr:hypothetical protein [Herbaspirillum sp. alder98]MCA1327154.1 hypothetical protein [Herbaspirillum sp. alder98]